MQVWIPRFLLYTLTRQLRVTFDLPAPVVERTLRFEHKLFTFNLLDDQLPPNIQCTERTPDTYKLQIRKGPSATATFEICARDSKNAFDFLVVSVEDSGGRSLYKSRPQRINTYNIEKLLSPLVLAVTRDWLREIRHPVPTTILLLLVFMLGYWTITSTREQWQDRALRAGLVAEDFFANPSNRFTDTFDGTQSAANWRVSGAGTRVDPSAGYLKIAGAGWALAALPNRDRHLFSRDAVVHDFEADFLLDFGNSSSITWIFHARMSRGNCCSGESFELRRQMEAGKTTFVISHGFCSAPGPCTPAGRAVARGPVDGFITRIEVKARLKNGTYSFQLLPTFAEDANPTFLSPFDFIGRSQAYPQGSIAFLGRPDQEYHLQNIVVASKDIYLPAPAAAADHGAPEAKQ